MPQQLHALLQAQIDAGLHLGARLYISQSSKIIVDLSVGQATPNVPMTHQTRMLWMSAGKPILAVALMQQVERGNLSLDDLVARHIPEFGVKGKETILIRHLLNHTGGFRLADKVATDHWEQAIAEISAVPLEPNWNVGVTGGYHVSGSWMILGELIQRVDRRDISTYIEEEIFSVCGMENCSLGITELDDSFSPMSLTEDPLAPILHPLYSDLNQLKQKRLGSNLIGPAHALGKFYEDLLSPSSKLLKPPSLRLMTQRQRKGVVDKTFKHIIDFGFGFALNSAHYGTQPVPYGFGDYASVASFGHGGNQSSVAFADPEKQLVFVYITNGMPGEKAHQNRMRDVMNGYYCSSKFPPQT